MKLFLISLTLLGVSVTAGAALLGQEGHGAVVFKTDDALRVFDALEYPQDGFIPSQLPEYQKLVKPALEALKGKLPKLAEKMERMFERGINPRWYFVSYSLREAHDEGNTHLMLTYEREQIALNDDGIIQIQRKLWDKLSEFDRAILLIHEVIWSTAEDGGIRKISGDAVRKLSTLIVDPNLSKFEAEQVALEVARRAKAICENLDSCPLFTLSRISSINRPAKGWEDISTSADDKTPTACGRQDHCVYSDEKTDLYWSSPMASKGATASWDEAKQACASLGHWGGVDSWRLPSTGELKEAAVNGIVEALSSDPSWRSSFNAFWSSSVSSSNENFALVVDLSNGVASRHRRSGSAPWLCVAGDFSKNWQDVSVNAAGASASCSLNTDHCAFLDRRTGLVWSERTPKYLEEDDTDKGSYGLSWLEAGANCASLGDWNGLGASWRLPLSKEFEAAYRHGLYRVALAYSDGFGEANDTFWLGDWEETMPSIISATPVAKRTGNLFFFDFLDGQVKHESFTSESSDTHLPPQPSSRTTERPWVCVRKAGK